MPPLVIRLPAITTEMDEGTLLTWMVTIGQDVKAGDPICEFTTDKVDTELESPYTGVVTQLMVPEGGQVKVGDAIAIVDGQGANLLGDLDEPDLLHSARSTQSVMRSHDHAPANPDDGAEPHDDSPALVPAPPAVRLEAQRRGIDLTTVVPSGSRGQVTMDDLDAVQQASTPPPSAGTSMPSNQGQDASPDEGMQTAPIPAHPDGGHEPSLATQRPNERRSRRAERTGGRRRGRAQRTVEPTQTSPVAHNLDQPEDVATLATPQPPRPAMQPIPMPVEPPCVLYATVDVTDLIDAQGNGLALLARLVWAYGQALTVHPEANAIWDTATQAAVALDTVYIDLGIETPTSTMESVPIAVPVDATIAQVGLSVTNSYGLVRAGSSPESTAPQRSGSLVDLGLWQVERFTPVIQPPQVTALSVGEVQTVPSLVGRTVTVRHQITIGLATDTRVLDPVQAGALLATIVAHTTNGDGI